MLYKYVGESVEEVDYMHVDGPDLFGFVFQRDLLDLTLVEAEGQLRLTFPMKKKRLEEIC
jgi:hypothetical protein